LVIFEQCGFLSSAFLLARGKVILNRDFGKFLGNLSEMEAIHSQAQRQRKKTGVLQ
jgi:hypothetical protein